MPYTLTLLVFVCTFFSKPCKFFGHFEKIETGEISQSYRFAKIRTR